MEKTAPLPRKDRILVSLLREDLPYDACFALDAPIGQLDALNRQIERIDAGLAEIHKPNPICRLLSTIPGIGPITATAFAATIPDPSAFPSEREFAACLGQRPGRTRHLASPGSVTLPSRETGICAIYWSWVREQLFYIQRRALPSGWSMD